MSFRDLLDVKTVLFVGACLGLGLLAACTKQPSPVRAPASGAAPLEGYWEGEGDSGEVSITISGSSLYFYARPDFQYDTSFTLPPDTDPPQLHATILDTPRTTDGAGELVIAIYEVEDDKLRLGVLGDSEGQPSFENAASHYYLERAERPE